MLLRNAGPQGGRACRNGGGHGLGGGPIPTKMVTQAVTTWCGSGRPHDSDTSYGACILARGAGTTYRRAIGMVRKWQDASRSMSAAPQRISLEDRAELKKNAVRVERKQPERRFERGYGWMFTKHIKQAKRAAISISRGGFWAPVGEP